MFSFDFFWCWELNPEQAEQAPSPSSPPPFPQVPNLQCLKMRLPWEMRFVEGTRGSKALGWPDPA